MKRRRLIIYVLLMLRSAIGAHAAELVTATDALNGDTLELSDGNTLHLDGIMAPDVKTPELAEAAKQKLQTLANKQQITIESPATNRYGQLTGQTYIYSDRKQRLWLQGEMLTAGLAFIYPPTGGEAQLAEMRKTEQDARKARRGIWANVAFADTPADKADHHIGRFAFVTGKVLDAAHVKNTIYLNFGPDWHTDFTAVIAAHDLRAFRKADMDPLELKGHMVRLRGWVIRTSGPAMDVTTPWQIDVLN